MLPTLRDGDRLLVRYGAHVRPGDLVVARFQDGTLGVKAIKGRGGLTLAQVADGHGPQHPNMPDSAIALGLVDFAVPADAMGGKLAEHARSLRRLDGMADAAGAEPDGEGQQQISAILRQEVGHDFAGYKSRTFMRRVQRRMQVNGLDTVEGYVDQLRHDPQEAAIKRHQEPSRWRH